MKRILIFILTAIFILILTFPDVGYPVKATLDGGYQYALNIIFSGRLKTGIDVIFSYGPLGFLHYPQPIGHNLAWGILFWGISKWLFISSLLLIVNHRQKKGNLLTGFVLAFLFANFIDVWSLPTFLLVTLLLLHRLKGRALFLIAAAIFCSLTFLIKVNYVMVNASILAVYAFFLAGGRSKKGFFQASLLFITSVLSFLLFWLASEGSLVGIMPYFKGMMEITSGNASAMTVSPPNNWSLLGSFLLLFFIQSVFVKAGDGYFLFILMFIPFWAVWKYTFMREDTPHLYNIVDFIIYYYLLLTIFAKRIQPLGFLIMILSVVLLSLNMTFLPRFGDINFIKNEFSRLYRLSGPANFYRQAIHYPKYKAALEKQSRENMQNFLLGEEIKNIIGKRTVDVYPWDLAYIYANALNFRPKPVLQSYVAYTPWLDTQDANFYRSAQAPDYLLWTRVHWGGETGSIDGRYLLNDEPQALLSIMQNYTPVKRGRNAVLWQRDGKGILNKGFSSGSVAGHWGEWVSPPVKEGGILRAKVKLDRSVIGNLKKALWKEDETYIEYKTAQKIYRYRLVPDNAMSGLWISPYLAQLERQLQGEKVGAVRLIHSPNDFFEPELTFEWVFYPLKQE